MEIVVVTPPVQEPLVLSEVKTFLRVDHDFEDGYIAALIAAAREYCEAYQRRAFINRELLVRIEKPQGVIKLPYPPLQTVQSIKYWDKYETVHQLENSDYTLDTVSVPGRIIPAGIWLCSARAMEVRYVAGYGEEPSFIPNSVKVAMLLLIGHWFENREAVSNVQGTTEFAVKALLDVERVVAV